MREHLSMRVPVDLKRLTRDELEALVRQYYEEIIVSRQAAEITARLNVEQFARMEELNQTLERAKLELERTSNLDGLTGVANRRYFEETLEKEWRRCRRNHRPLGVILLDIDDFKKFNDRYGHVAGDQCLQQVARALQWIIQRAADSVARYGGEEFVYLLPESDEKALEVVAERARSAVEQLGIPHAGSRAAPIVTISLGGAVTIPSSSQKPDEMLRHADQALYQAKKEGRNRFCLYPHN
ncbi:MAG: GGDEF domain-containing protein [Caldilineae bacterium]|nr:MAG: GGDEF domain-containing protein [Caldilineae bacterium]